MCIRDRVVGESLATKGVGVTRVLLKGPAKAVSYTHLTGDRRGGRSRCADEDAQVMTVSKQRYEICVLPGDGIGPEIMRVALEFLHAVGRKHGIEFACIEAPIGGCAIDACGNALPCETVELARRADAVLLGAVGGPRWDTVDPDAPRPEDGLLGIRKELGLYANLRPVHVYDALLDASPLKPATVRGCDILIVRELTGGLYFGEHVTVENVAGAGANGSAGAHAHDVMRYDCLLYTSRCV